MTERQENETAEQYMSRLLIGKRNKTIELSWERIATLLDHRFTVDYLRKLARGMVLSAGVPIDAEKVTIEKNKDGSITDERIIQLEPGEFADDVKVMKAHSYDPDIWEVVSSKHSIWQAHTKAGPTKTLYASKITVKPRLQLLDAKSLISEAMRLYTPPRHAPTNYSRNGKLLFVPIPDLHLNAFSWHGETGVDYDSKIARAMVEWFISEIISRIGNNSYEKIIISPMGDFAHVDNAVSTTTKGTPQDTDTRYPKMYALAYSIAMMIIDQFSSVAPTEWVHIPGNHDNQASFGISFALNQFYSLAKKPYNVSINADPIARKAVEYGSNLIGLMHGEMPKAAAQSWLTNEHREACGRCEHRIIFGGHFHTEIYPGKDGVPLWYLPTMKPIDKWHYDMGYVWASRTARTFTFDKADGMTDVWVTNIKETK